MSGGTAADVPSLVTALADFGADPTGYRILGQPDEATRCIRKQGRTWLVFYFERGTRRELQDSRPKAPPANTSTTD